MRRAILIPYLACLGAPASAAAPFDYFANSFTVVGLKDHPSGTRISPRGELLLGGGRVLRPVAGRSLAPLRAGTRAALRAGCLPIVERELALDGGARAKVEAFARPASGDPGGFERPASDDFLNLVRVSLRGEGEGRTEGVAGFEIEPRSPIEARPARGGRQLLFVAGALLGAVRASGPGRIEIDGPRVVFRASLERGEEARCDFALPHLAHADPPAELLRALEEADFDADAESAARFWRGLMARGAEVIVPEDKARETYLASIVYQFIGRDRGEVHAGEGFYDEMYLRDGAYQAISLAHAGYLEEARESLQHLLRFAKPDGQLESQAGQLDANGYGMWAPVELWKLSGDLEWLRSAYPRVRGAARWAMRARRLEVDPASPFRGLLPAAPADGENLWAGDCHIVGYDWWNLRGIGCAAEAARALGEEADAREFEREFEDYRAAILEALSKTGLPYIPPSYEKRGTHWGNLEVVFPTPLLSARHPLVTATLRHVREEFGAPEGPRGFVEGTIQWTPGSGAIHPYMSQFVTNAHIARGERDEAVDGLYSFLLHTTSTHGFPEGVYWRRRSAWGDTVPHLWAAALYVTTLRNCLIREDADEASGEPVLELLGAVPDLWLEAGKAVGISRAPTRYGTFSFLLEAGADSAALRFEWAGRRKPAAIEVRLPRGIAARAADGAGARVAPGGSSIRIAPDAASGGAVRILIERRGPASPASFASKVAEYEAGAVDPFRPIPGLLLAVPPDAASAEQVPLDLASAATTNPFDGPFRVSPAPTFAGLPVGAFAFEGIRFRTVDPAANRGRGIVVLDGASASKGLPVEVEVPAGGARGRYLAVLGGVTGWAPADPGTGDLGAVAECVVRYADGTRSSLPWISGRTADDWLGAPGASDAAATMRGSPWHLNLLLFALEPKPVEAVLVRDLGTPSSPVVAAITIVR